MCLFVSKLGETFRDPIGLRTIKFKLCFPKRLMSFSNTLLDDKSA